ncbi:MAG: hypothetical protein ACC700_20915, partial [Anaerolineales bacterium]
MRTILQEQIENILKSLRIFKGLGSRRGGILLTLVAIMISGIYLFIDGRIIAVSASLDPGIEAQDVDEIFEISRVSVDDLPEYSQ